MANSPSIAELFAHIHYVRSVFVLEDAPEFSKRLPDEEWVAEPDRARLAQLLNKQRKGCGRRGQEQSGDRLER